MDRFVAKNDVIVLPIGKILIIRNKGKKQFFKINLDNTIQDLSAEENNYINRIFNAHKDTIIYSEIAWDIARNNTYFQENANWWGEVIRTIELLIPNGSKENFYRNLQTLQIEEMSDEEDNEHSKYITPGKYSTTENKIYISKKYINQIDIIHELIHMASTYYDKETGIVKTGFDVFCKDGTSISSNRGLTEGITDYLTQCILKMLGIDVDIQRQSGYSKEMLISKQIIMLGERKVVLEEYFKASGIDGIKAQMKPFFLEYFIYDEIVDDLFDRIEDTFLLKQEEQQDNFSSTLPFKIQNTLLVALEKKIEIYIENNTINNISDLEEYLNLYRERMLIPENLNGDISKFPGLEMIPRTLEQIKERCKQRISGIKSQENQEISAISLQDIEETTSSINISDINTESKIIKNIASQEKSNVERE